MTEENQGAVLPTNEKPKHYINKNGDILLASELDESRGHFSSYISTDRFLSEMLDIPHDHGVWKFIEALSDYTGNDLDIILSVFRKSNQSKIDSLFEKYKQESKYKVGDETASDILTIRIDKLTEGGVSVAAWKNNNADPDDIKLYTYSLNGFDLKVVLNSLTARARGGFKTPRTTPHVKNRPTDEPKKSLFEITGSTTSREVKLTVVSETIDGSVIERAEKKYPSLKIFQIKRIGVIDVL